MFSLHFHNCLNAIVTFHRLSLEVMETKSQKFICGSRRSSPTEGWRCILQPDRAGEAGHAGYDTHLGARPLPRQAPREGRDPLTAGTPLGA